MLGAIIGDIVGSRFEFNNTKDFNFELFTKECSYTDDTICTVAIADAILNDSDDYRSYLLKWCRKYPHPMGAYGGSFSRWIASDNPQPYNSWGNGSAMRVSPIGFSANNQAEVIRHSILSASVSHNHPDGIVGAMAVAHGIFLLRCGHGVKNTVNALMKTYYGEEWEYNIPKPGQWNETCQGCVPLAFSILIRSNDFEDAIRKAVAYGGDSDTLGAIVGSLAEAAFGIPKKIAGMVNVFLPNDMLDVVKQFNDTYR